MTRCRRASRRAPFQFAAAVAIAIAVAACAGAPGRDEQEAGKDTFACQLAGERVVLRFDVDEVRLLMPDGNRVVLYQIPSASGVRYSNGNLELRGKGNDMQLIRNGVASPFADCAPYTVPK